MPSEYEQIAALQERERLDTRPVEHSAMQRAVVIQMTELMREDKWATYKAHVEALDQFAQAMMAAANEQLKNTVGNELMLAQLAYKKWEGVVEGYRNVLGLPELVVKQAPEQFSLTSEPPQA